MAYKTVQLNVEIQTIPEETIQDVVEEVYELLRTAYTVATVQSVQRPSIRQTNDPFEVTPPLPAHFNGDPFRGVPGSDVPHCRKHLEFRSDCEDCVSEREWKR